MRFLLAAAALLLATPAWAGLPVAYDADYKTLKKSVYIGDPLAFELYETTDCSGAPVYSEILGAGTPEFHRAGQAGTGCQATPSLPS